MRRWMPKFDLRTMLVIVGIVAVICAVVIIPGAYAVHLPIAIISGLAIFFAVESYRHYASPSPLRFRTHWRLCICFIALTSFSAIYFSVADYAISHYLGKREVHDLKSQLLNIDSASELRSELLAVSMHFLPPNSPAQTRLPVPVDALPESIRKLEPEKAVVTHGGVSVYFFANQQQQAATFMLFAAQRNSEPPEHFEEIAPGLWLYQGL